MTAKIFPVPVSFEELCSKPEFDTSVGDKDAKWQCLPGPHHPGFFQNTERSKWTDKMCAPAAWQQQRAHTTNKMADDPYRLWKSDTYGIRRMDWHPVPADCPESKPHPRPIQKPFPQYDQQLWRYERKLEEAATLRHPANILHEFLYRDPSKYLKERWHIFRNSVKQGDESVYQTDKLVPMPAWLPPDSKTTSTDDDENLPSEKRRHNETRDVWRYRFLANNYMGMEDWKDHPCNDELMKRDIELSAKIANRA